MRARCLRGRWDGGLDTIASELEARGADVTAIDVRTGCPDHDVTSDEVATRMAWVRDHRFDAVFAAPPCSSFSVAHKPPLRSRAQPEGVKPMPRRWARYVRKHNAIIAGFTAELVSAAAQAVAVWALENPADCNDAGSAAWWPRVADHARIWLLHAARTRRAMAGW
eukprot:5859629-Pleurochrysis_carterae.AAC.1